ncbi:receptor-type tyrosine-protein phosphatase beta-like protein [Lates japonicus]|uniref:Receptor-type tyrosine-protein phosphatase beta-like protein n=1 Tax=Lates japonicus TaxID=270547 RepID=A0AAD3NKB6_LATJO|nr:receptor-type tyrosine-protein phosphatase beta-like protein [Lates japonicus]
MCAGLGGRAPCACPACRFLAPAADPWGSAREAAWSSSVPWGLHACQVGPRSKGDPNTQKWPHRLPGGRCLRRRQSAVTDAVKAIATTRSGARGGVEEQLEGLTSGSVIRWGHLSAPHSRGNSRGTNTPSLAFRFRSSGDGQMTIGRSAGEDERKEEIAPDPPTHLSAKQGPLMIIELSWSGPASGTNDNFSLQWTLPDSPVSHKDSPDRCIVGGCFRTKYNLTA